MGKKHTIKKIAAVCLGVALTVGATGCNFFVADSQEDLKQIVATVDISGQLKEEVLKSGIQTLIKDGGLSTSIYKRELIAYFMSYGYNYVNSYGYSYEDTFNLLMDGLASNKILTQYAVAYHLQKGAADGITAEKCIAFVNGEIEKATGTEKALLAAHPEVLTMKYFLTDGGKTDKDSMEEYNKTVYSLMKSFNSSLDSAEANYIKAENAEHSHEDTRTTPTGVSTQNEEYYPINTENNTLNYGVYTGRNSVPNNYKPVKGSTPTTRKKAYNAFIANLDGYGLIQEGEDTAFVTELDYFYVELSTALSQALVNKYYEELQDEAIAKLAENDYELVKNKYNDILAAQELAYKNDDAAFETAIGALADDAFVLYGKQDFGFVYNILIPFSASQGQAYAAAKNKNMTEAQLFDARKQILAGVQAQDLRGAWFCNDLEADDHYAYESEGKYYFFEDSVKNAGEGKEFKQLKQYLGNFPYQGEATYDESAEEWTVKADKIGVVYNDGAKADTFLDVFENYVTSQSGVGYLSVPTKNAAYGTNYYLDESNNPTSEKTDRVNYNAFIYYEGQFEVNGTANDFFVRDTENYNTVAAVNEIMFAYSTDPGCLNTYMGYAVSPVKTSFVPEFEYAAQKAVKQGVGAYNLVATDYGWHLIYCSFKYDGGAVYGASFDATKIEQEGTFEYMFYESLKSTASTNYKTAAQSKVMNEFEDSVTLHKKKYKDLLELGA